MRNRRLTTLVAGLALAVPGLAHAAKSGTSKAGAAKSPESDLGAGMALFTNGDFRGALLRFNAALAQVHGNAETAQLHLLRGQCFVALGDQPDARQAFELALEQDSEAQVDPSKAPPEVVSLLAEVRSGLHAELTLLGQGASATFDGVGIGPLPIHQRIPIGRHVLEVATADRRFDQKQELVARPGDSIALTFDVPGSSPTPLVVMANPAPTAAPAPPAVSASTPPAAVATAPSPEQGSSPFSLGLPVDLFGHVGALADPVHGGLGFEAGAGVGWGLLYGSVSGIWGASAGLVPRIGVATSQLIGPLGAYADAELPIFFASRTDVGLGAEAGLSWKLWLFEPYAGLAVQHFFSTPSGASPHDYLLIPFGVRVHVP